VCSLERGILCAFLRPLNYPVGVKGRNKDTQVMLGSRIVNERVVSENILKKLFKLLLRLPN
jgi:hypothetical protein